TQPARTGGEILVECLKRQGVKVVFGMPGGHLNHLYDALHRHQADVRHITVRNEQGASLMADGYARATGDVGVCLTIPGPGASNAATGIAEAFSASSPVLLITGQPEAKFAGHDRHKVFHGLDHLSFFKPITKWNGSVARAEDIPSVVTRAFEALRCGRPGPVHLEVPSDVLSAQAQVAIPDRVEPRGTAAASDAVERAARLLSSAKRPIILVGEEVVWYRASDELAEFAALLGAPVVTSIFAKGALPEDHPWSLGDIRTPEAQKALAEADGVLAVGCRFLQFETANWTLKLPRLIHVSADEHEIGRDYAAEVGIVGDAKSVLGQLAEALRGKTASAWGGRVAELKAAWTARRKHPLVAALQDALGRDGLVAVDVHITGYRMRTEFRVHGPRQFLSSGVYVTLGFGLPEAIGAKATFPDRPVVAFCGDGGFMMTCQELATAVQFGLNVVTVVVNDNCFTSIKGGQQHQFGGRFIGVDLRNPDFVKFAESFGALARRVERPEEFRPSLEWALKASAPALIEVPPLRS
ncbi:MAG: thiamine pyrophosphate-binding protein, partial [Planctomycetes bacterium]|nr:thiamine pyrophosphate-binding protein [Planctomycetota bacterium]